MIEQELELIGTAFPLTKRDAGDYTAIEKFGMIINMGWYAAEGLGNVATISSSGMPGMQIATLVIDPFYRDIALLSLDMMAMSGQRNELVEFYDTMLQTPDAGAIAKLQTVKDSFASLPDMPQESRWYDSMRLDVSAAKSVPEAEAAKSDSLHIDYLKAYLDWAQATEPCTDPRAKRAKAATYVDGLLTQGGPSTDQFTQMLGPDMTRDMFTRIVFGTAD